VFDVMTRNAADDRSELRFGVRNDNVADVDASNRADRRLFRSAHPATKAQENRRGRHVTHREVRGVDVFDNSAINSFDGESAAMVEGAIRDRDIFEASVRFSAEFDSTGWAITVRRLRLRAFKRAVEKRARIVAGDLAVDDGHIFRCARIAESEGTLQTDAVVIGRINAAIRDAHIAAGVNVQAVAGGVYLDVIDRQGGDPGR